ncbi:hypothetical protein K439DRAFT_1398422 [Ramaria rubella]|nr:hypothetical protein K439DRAFT_1398422 [Ramaria rubella]
MKQMTTKLGTLCLACSSSPSPKAQLSTYFTTPCCARPICERCLAKNPRLRGYNPCLACLAGVALVSQPRTPNGKSSIHRMTVPGPSGQSQDQEEGMFVLGDSDEEEDQSREVDGEIAPPPYAEPLETISITTGSAELINQLTSVQEERSNPSKYYIQHGDTLRGIALRYGVDGRKICQLNSLPFSTLNTTPHLLHTRRWLSLPPTGLPLLPPPDPKVVEERNRERAEKRFQMVTKEVDWRVAKAYVALAQEEDDDAKAKENLEAIKAASKALNDRALEAKAIDQYLDDDEWETRQGGSGEIRVQGFPPFASSDGLGEGKVPERVTLSSRLGKLIRS